MSLTQARYCTHSGSLRPSSRHVAGALLLGELGEALRPEDRDQRIAGQDAHDHEDHDRHADHGQRAERQPAGDVAIHDAISGGVAGRSSSASPPQALFLAVVGQGQVGDNGEAVTRPREATREPPCRHRQDLTPCARGICAAMPRAKLAMNKGRLEAFSDGVIAIIITIMVLEMKVPHGDGPRGAAAAAAGVPELRAELRLRRHLLEQPPPHAPGRATRQRRRCCGPTCTCCSGCRCSRSSPAGWARTISRRCPSALYGVVLLMAAHRLHHPGAPIDRAARTGSTLARAVGSDIKGNISIVLYAAAIPLAFVSSGWRSRSTSRGRPCGSFPTGGSSGR